MSTQYKHSDRVPDDVLADRLDQLADAVAKRDMSEFYMRIPAELDHDADLVLSEAAKRIRVMRQDNSVPFDASEPEWRPRADHPALKAKPVKNPLFDSASLPFGIWDLQFWSKWRPVLALLDSRNSSQQPEETP